MVLEHDGVIAPVDHGAERHHGDARALVIVGDLDCRRERFDAGAGRGARDRDRRRCRIRGAADALGVERRGEHAARQKDQQRAEWRTAGATHGHLSVTESA